MEYPVVKYPDPILREEMPKVTDFEDPSLKEDINKLRKIVSQLKVAVGLAAPQAGIRKSLLYIDCEKIKSPIDVTVDGHTGLTRWLATEGNGMVLINPVVVELGPKKKYGMEGCLSFPGGYEKVQRSTEVVVQYQDESGEQHEIKATGFMARVLQHEIDHLNGVLFIDRMRKQAKKRILQRVG